MKILIIETEKYGHNLHLYLKAILKKFSNKNKIFLLTSEDLCLDKNFKQLKKKYKFTTLKEKFPEKPEKYNFYTSVIYQFKYYFCLQKFYKIVKKKLNFDHIYINNINHFDKAISILGSPFCDKKFSVFYTNLNIFLGNKKYSKKRYSSYIYFYLFSRFFKIKNLVNIFISNPILFKFLKKKKFKSKIKYVEEFSILENIKSKLNLNKIDTQRNKTILVYGRIREDKDIENLLHLLKYKYVQKNVSIIIAGQQEKKISELIEKKSNEYNNIITINRFIDSRMEKVLFSISDFIWIGYKLNFYGSSAVFFQSSLAEKPIICSNHGLVSFLNKIYKIGLSTNLNNSLKIIKFIRNDIKISKSRYNKINSIHNEKNFVNKIYNEIVKNETNN